VLRQYAHSLKLVLEQGHQDASGRTSGSGAGRERGRGPGGVGDFRLSDRLGGSYLFDPPDLDRGAVGAAVGVTAAPGTTAPAGGPCTKRWRRPA
jgi:hypothetical protein